MHVWVKPHRTLPNDATLWGALGYEEGSDALETCVAEFRKWLEEAREVEEKRKAELTGRNMSAQELRVQMVHNSALSLRLSVFLCLSEPLRLSFFLFLVVTDVRSTSTTLQARPLNAAMPHTASRALVDLEYIP